MDLNGSLMGGDEDAAAAAAATATDSLEVPPLPPPPADMVNLNNEEPLPFVSHDSVVATPPPLVDSDAQTVPGTDQHDIQQHKEETVSESLHITPHDMMMTHPISAEIVDHLETLSSNKQTSPIVEVVTSTSIVGVQYDYTKSMQKCSSCGMEKATIICSNCRPLGDQQSKLKVQDDDDDDNEPTSKCVAFSLNTDEAEKTNLSIELQHQHQNTLRNKISVESLIKSGNMLYCHECFLAVHQTIKNTHMPIDLKSSTSAKIDYCDSVSGVQVAAISTVDEIIETVVPPPPPALTMKTTKEDKERMKQEMAKLTRELDMLKKRQTEFNGVKTSIKHMNETIREDLMLDFSSVADQMKSKLDEITNKIKEKLKDAYSVIRDMHEKIPGRLEEINKNMKELERLVHNDDNEDQIEDKYAQKSGEIVDQINQLNSDLRLVCEHYKSNTSNTQSPTTSPHLLMLDANHNNLLMHTLNSTSTTHHHSPPSMSLFVEDRLYPQFNYLVDLTHLRDIVDSICVQINSPEANKSRMDLMTKYTQMRLVPGLRLFCTAMTGLSNDGSFWIHVIGEARLDEATSSSATNETGGVVNEDEDEIYDIYDPLVQQKLLIQYGKERIKSNMFLEEISKTIRRLRIGRRECKTFSEMMIDNENTTVPRVNQKCFCYDQRSQKWLRARVVSVDVARRECQVKYLDTGANDEGRLPAFDSMIDADLVSLYDEQHHHHTQLPYRSLKCYLHKTPQYNDNVCSLVADTGMLLLPDSASTPLLANPMMNLMPDKIGDSTCGDKYEKNVSLDTRYLFKDITLNKNLLCELVERVVDDPERDVESWTIKLTYVKAESGGVGTSSTTVKQQKRGDGLDSINKRIISHNTVVNMKLAENQNPFSCTDIRVASGQLPPAPVNIIKPVVVTDQHPTSPPPPPIQMEEQKKQSLSSISMSCISTASVLYDFSDEVRMCAEREGLCRVTSQLSRYGTFWIRPVMNNLAINGGVEDDLAIVRHISHTIDSIMSRPESAEVYKSYSQLARTPQLGEMCLVRLRSPSGRSHRWEWHRALIDTLDVKSERCSARQLDKGNFKETYWSDAYPLTDSLHSELVSLEPSLSKFLAIRCSLFDQKCRMRDGKLLDEFERRLKSTQQTGSNSSTYSELVRFKLIKRIQSKENGNYYWYTLLFSPNDPSSSSSSPSSSINQAIYQRMSFNDRMQVHEPNKSQQIDNANWLANPTPSLPVQLAVSSENDENPKSKLRSVSSLDNIKLIVSSIVADNNTKQPPPIDEIKETNNNNDDDESMADCPNSEPANPVLPSIDQVDQQQLGSKSINNWDLMLSPTNANLLCFKCYERGHLRKHCKNSKVIKCLRCLETGHSAKDCSKRYPPGPGQTAPVSSVTNEPTPSTSSLPQTSEKAANESTSSVSRKDSIRSKRGGGGCKPDTDSVKGDHHRRKDGDDNRSPCRRLAATFPAGSGSQQQQATSSTRSRNSRGGRGGAGGGGNTRTTNVMSDEDDDDLEDHEIVRGGGVLMSDESDAVFEDSIEHHVIDVGQHPVEVVKSGGLVDIDNQQQQQQQQQTRSWLRSLQQDHLAEFEQEEREKTRRLISDLESDDNLDDLVASLTGLTTNYNINGVNNNNNGLDVTQPVDNRHALLLESAADAGGRHQADNDDIDMDNYSVTSSTTSTSNGSIDSLKKAKQMLSDNDESFASCTDEIQNAANPAGKLPPSSRITTTTSSSGAGSQVTTTTPTNNQTIGCEASAAIVATSAAAAGCSNCGNSCGNNDKLERMKQFKVAIFVESFDDYSFSSSSLNNNHNVSQSSLKEFEQIEMATGLSIDVNAANNNNNESMSRLLANDDDEFMYESNANYDYILNHRDVAGAAKPPISTTPSTATQQTSQSSNNNRLAMSMHNAPSNLSTISECTNETYNESNHSRDRLPSAASIHPNQQHSSNIAPLSPSAYDLVNSDEATSDAAMMMNGEHQRHVTNRRHRSGSKRDADDGNSNPAIVSLVEIQGNNCEIRQAIHKLIDKARDIQLSLIDENNSSLEIGQTSTTSNLPPPPPPPAETLNQSMSLLPSCDITDKLFAEFSQQLGESILGNGVAGTTGNQQHQTGSLVRTNNSYMLEDMLNNTTSMDHSVCNNNNNSLPPRTPPPARRSIFKQQTPVTSQHHHHHHQPDSTSSSTLEISSYTMESMSNFVVTPLVSQSTINHGPGGANFVTISVSPRHHQNQVPPSPRSITSMPTTLPLPSPPTFILNQQAQQFQQQQQQQQQPVFSSQNFTSPTTAGGTLSCFTSPLPPPPPPPAPPLPPNGLFTQQDHHQVVATPASSTNNGLVNTVKAQLEQQQQDQKKRNQLAMTNNSSPSRNEEEKAEVRSGVFQTGKMTLYGLDNEEEQHQHHPIVTNHHRVPISSPPSSPPVNLFQIAKANLRPVVPAVVKNVVNYNDTISTPTQSLSGSDSIFMPSSQKTPQQPSAPSLVDRHLTPDPPAQSSVNWHKDLSTRMAKIAASSPSSSPKSCPEHLIKSSIARDDNNNEEEEGDSVYSSMSSRQCLSVTQRAEMPPSEFKLDHLSDINPKRLYETCKFRCRIHDVIDKSGCLGIEVIYPDEDERKFKQLFKLFRLASAINKPPSHLQRLQRVSAFYRGHWHRAVVVKSDLDSNPSSVEVKFCDLGIRRVVDRHHQVRHIDDKFFNFPLKSVYCTVSVDDELQKMLQQDNKQTRLDKMCLSLEARRFFTKQVLGKLLFAKVIGLREQQPVKLILGAQTKRGIIDVFMYTMSKFDRTRYELIKQLHHNKTQIASGVPPIQTTTNLEMLLLTGQKAKLDSMEEDNETTTTLDTTLTHDDECASSETTTNMSVNSNAQMCSDDGGPRDTNNNNYSENFDDDQNDYQDEEEEEETFDETESALFSNLYDFVIRPQQKNDFEYGLDLTPVSEKKSTNQQQQTRGNNNNSDNLISCSSMSHKSISLAAPPKIIRNFIHPHESSSGGGGGNNRSVLREHQTPVRSNENDWLTHHQKSTVQVNSRNRMIRAQQEQQTPRILQHQQQLLSTADETDDTSSLSQINCCQIVGLKHKSKKELSSKSKSSQMPMRDQFATDNYQSTIDVNELNNNKRAVKFITN